MAMAKNGEKTTRLYLWERQVQVFYPPRYRSSPASRSEATKPSVRTW
jgi:hypothetical protein